jgi:hypothetical protein
MPACELTAGSRPNNLRHCGCKSSQSLETYGILLSSLKTKEMEFANSIHEVIDHRRHDGFQSTPPAWGATAHGVTYSMR